MEYTTLTDDQLEAARLAILTEQERRRTLSEAPALIEQVTAQFQAAAGISDGTEWRQPTGAHDAVPPGGTRVFGGTLYENTSGAWLAHSPADYPAGWTSLGEAEPVVPEPGDHPEWAAGVAYKIDDIVTYGGQVYRVIQAHTSAAHWPPDQVASLYSSI